MVQHSLKICFESQIIKAIQNYGILHIAHPRYYLNRNYNNFMQAPAQQPKIPGTPTQVPANLRKGSSESIQTNQQDTKSIFIQSLDFAATNQDVQAIFQDCGTINRITILKTQTGQSKGSAYVQFADVQSVQHALMLSGTIFRKRAIKVSQKRTNIRGMSNKRGHPGGGLFFSSILSSLGKRKF